MPACMRCAPVPLAAWRCRSALVPLAAGLAGLAARHPAGLGQHAQVGHAVRDDHARGQAGRDRSADVPSVFGEAGVSPTA